MARKMNYDAAKRRQWRNEARVEKARERAHDAVIRQAEREVKLRQPASERQLSLIEKWNMLDVYNIDKSVTLTVGVASEIIQRFAKDNGWSGKNKSFRHPQPNETTEQYMMEAAKFNSINNIPMTEPQKALIVKHGMLVKLGRRQEDINLLNKATASKLIDLYAKKNNWKPLNKK